MSLFKVLNRVGPFQQCPTNRKTVFEVFDEALAVGVNQGWMGSIYITGKYLMGPKLKKNLVASLALDINL